MVPPTSLGTTRPTPATLPSLLARPERSRWMQAALLPVRWTSPAVTFFTGGAITAAGGLTKAGTGTMQIRNNNSITGNIVISGGELQLGHNGGTGSLNGGSFAGNISIATGSTFRDRSNNSVTHERRDQRRWRPAQGWHGTMTLTGPNTYTGQTNLQASGAGGPHAQRLVAQQCHSHRWVWPGHSCQQLARCSRRCIGRHHSSGFWKQHPELHPDLHRQGRNHRPHHVRELQQQCERKRSRQMALAF